MKRTPSVSPPRPFRASGVANVVAPSRPLGRARAAVAVTAVLVGVQLGLMAEGAGSDLCQLTGGVSCLPAQLVFGGGVLEGQDAPLPPAPPGGANRPSPASGGRTQLEAPATHTVALRTAAPTVTNQQAPKVGKAKATVPSGTSKKGKHARSSAIITTASVRHHRHGHSPASRVSASARHR